MDLELARVHLINISDMMNSTVYTVVYVFVLLWIIKEAISCYRNSCKEAKNDKKPLIVPDETGKNIEAIAAKIDMLQTLFDHQYSVINKIATQNAKMSLTLENLGVKTVACGGAPLPPPPPPPPLMPIFNTPVTSQIYKEELKPRKKPDGPPQPSLTQEDVSNVLLKLRKTGNKERLLKDEVSPNKRTPSRKTLFKKKLPLKRRSDTKTTDEPKQSGKVFRDGRVFMCQKKTSKDVVKPEKKL